MRDDDDGSDLCGIEGLNNLVGISHGLEVDEAELPQRPRQNRVRACGGPADCTARQPKGAIDYPRHREFRTGDVVAHVMPLDSHSETRQAQESQEQFSTTNRCAGMLIHIDTLDHRSPTISQAFIHHILYTHSKPNLPFTTSPHPTKSQATS